MPCCHEFKKHEDEINYEEIEACYNKLREIDDFLSSKEMRIQLFGEKNADKHEYQPIVCTVEDLEDTKNNFRPPYAKSTLELAYDDDSPTLRSSIRKTGSERRSF